jgi:hypothetical protein
MMPAAKRGARLILGSGDLLSKDPRRDRILHWGVKNTLSGGADASRDQPDSLADLHSLGAPFCAELIK